MHKLFTLVLLIIDTKDLRVPTLTLKRKCENCGMILSMFKNFAKKVPVRIKNYTRENWGAPFIVSFMLLLFGAAFTLSLELSALANEVAIYAYYALVVGIVLQIVCFLKNDKRNRGKNYEPS